MYNIHDFIARRCCIVIKKPEQYRKTMDWFRRYNLTFWGEFLDEQCDFYEVKGQFFSCHYGVHGLKDLLQDNIDGVESKLALNRAGYIATIEEMDFDENRLYDVSQSTPTITLEVPAGITYCRGVDGMPMIRGIAIEEPISPIRATTLTTGGR